MNWVLLRNQWPRTKATEYDSWRRQLAPHLLPLGVRPLLETAQFSSSQNPAAGPAKATTASSPDFQNTYQWTGGAPEESSDCRPWLLGQYLKSCWKGKENTLIKNKQQSHPLCHYSLTGLPTQWHCILYLLSKLTATAPAGLPIPHGLAIMQKSSFQWDSNLLSSNSCCWHCAVFWEASKLVKPRDF